MENKPARWNQINIIREGSANEYIRNKSLGKIISASIRRLISLLLSMFYNICSRMPLVKRYFSVSCPRHFEGSVSSKQKQLCCTKRSECSIFQWTTSLNAFLLGTHSNDTRVVRDMYKVYCTIQTIFMHPLPLGILTQKISVAECNALIGGWWARFRNCKQGCACLITVPCKCNLEL